MHMHKDLLEDLQDAAEDGSRSDSRQAAIALAIVDLTTMAQAIVDVLEEIRRQLVNIQKSMP